MKPGPAILGQLALQFAILSLVAFGGANAVVPEIQRQAVGVQHWMTSREFVALFAIANAAPGPNVMIATLIGWKAGGIPGALIATLCMCGPSCVLTFFAARLWDRYRDRPWRQALGAGLAPVTVGLVISTAWVLSRAADVNVRLALVTLGTAAVVLSTRLNPLWCLAAAATLGWLGVFSG